jgi:hypothetical protein
MEPQSLGKSKPGCSELRDKFLTFTFGEDPPQVEAVGKGPGFQGFAPGVGTSK